MSVKTKLHTLYKECICCPNSEQDCPGIKRDRENGFFPRGFYFETAPIDILVVGKNPGQPGPDEIKKFGELSGEDLYLAMRQDQELCPPFWCQQNDPFDRRLSRYLCYLLEVEDKKIFSRIAFTNLVKCSSIEDEEHESTDWLDDQTKENCFHRYLKFEVSHYSPKVILALGREAEIFLLRKSWRYLGAPVLYINHPSYPMGKAEEPKVLQTLKEEMDYYLRKV